MRQSLSLVRPQTGQGLVLDEVEKSDPKFPPVEYDVVISLIAHRLGERDSKDRCVVGFNYSAAVFGVYKYCQKLKTQQDELNG